MADATARAAGWAVVATISGRVVSLGGLILLARLLAPEEFGLVAVALTYVMYVESVSDLGTRAALIYWPDDKDEAALVTFVISWGLSWLWFGLTLLLAPIIASFFRYEAVEAVLIALAWVFPIKALGSTHDAILQKELSFRARLIAEVGLVAAKAIMAVYLAQLGFGPWSLVWGHLAGVAAWTGLLWIAVPWKPRWRMPKRLFRPMLSYGRHIVAVNFLAAVLHHVDLLVVGRMLGAAALGFYQIAYKVPEMTIIMLVRAASAVLFPAFSRMRGDVTRLGRAYVTALHYIALLTLPAAVGLALVAHPLVLTVFGPGWEPAVPILSALAIYTGLRALGSHAGDVMKAAGQPALLAKLGLVKVLVLVPALVVAASRGPVAVAVAMAAVTTVTMALNMAAVSRLTGVSAGTILVALRPSAVAVVALTSVLLLWNQIASGYTSGAHLTGALLLGGGAYALALRVFTPDIYRRAAAHFGFGKSLVPAHDHLALVNDR